MRILLLDQDLQVVFDSEDDAAARQVRARRSRRDRVKSAEAGGISYKWADFDGEDTHPDAVRGAATA